MVHNIHHTSSNNPKSTNHQAIERAVEQYMVEYVQDLDHRATQSATGQYPVTRPIQLPSLQQEHEAAEAQKAGTGTAAGLGGVGGVGEGFGTTPVMSKTMPVTTIGPEEKEEEGMGAAGPEEVRPINRTNLYFKGVLIPMPHPLSNLQFGAGGRA